MVNTNEKLAEGWILCRAIIEVLGKPKEHVEEAIKMYVEQMKNDKELIIVNSEFSEPEEQETMFSAFVEIEILAKNSSKIVWFCFDYLPASIEILEPENIVYKSRDFTAFLNDLQARMHMVGTELKIKQQENAVLDRNGQKILENFIYFCLINKEHNIDEISAFTGIRNEQLEPFLKKMAEQGRIHKKEDRYSAKR